MEIIVHHFKKLQISYFVMYVLVRQIIFTKKKYFKVISMKTLILIITWKESRKINNRSASLHILFIFQFFPTNIQVQFDARTLLLQVPYWCKYCIDAIKYCIDASTIYWSKYMTDVSTVLMYVLHWCKFSIDVSSVLI